MSRNRYFEDEILEASFKGKMLLKMLRYVKPYRKQVLTIGILMLIVSIVALFPPLLNRLIVDRVLPAAAGAPPRDNWLFYACIAIGGIASIAIAEVVFGFFRNRIMAKIGYMIVRDLRQDVYNHMQRLSFDYFDKRPAGKILVRLTNYIDELASMFSTVIIGFIIDAVKIVVILLFLFVIDYRFALIVFAVIVPMAVLLVVIHRVLAKRHRTMRNRISNRTAYIAENINGIFVTKTFNRTALNTDIFEDLCRQTGRAWRRVIAVNEFFLPTVEVFWYLGMVLVYTFALVFETQGGGVGVGTITSLVLYLSMFAAPINNIAASITQLATATSNVERIFELRDTPPMISDSKEAYSAELNGHVCFDNVCFSYDGKVNVLDSFCLDVPAGKTIALVGPTGAGKSTVVGLIPRFYEASSGRVLIDGHDVRSLLLGSLRSQVGVMLQDNFIISGTIMDNIRYGDLSATREQCIEAARSACLEDVVNRLPDGYETYLTDNDTTLSAGEKRLISFARTILSNPKILILDEATSSIDSETEEKIQTAITGLLANRTSFIVAHRLSTIKKSDCILYIADGGIAEAGTYDQLMAQGGRFFKLATNQR